MVSRYARSQTYETWNNKDSSTFVSDRTQRSRGGADAKVEQALYNFCIGAINLGKFHFSNDLNRWRCVYLQSLRAAIDI